MPLVSRVHPPLAAVTATTAVGLWQYVGLSSACLGHASVQPVTWLAGLTGPPPDQTAPRADLLLLQPMREGAAPGPLCSTRPWTIWMWCVPTV